MSHAITQRKSGKVEMAYVGETPWHGLGEKLTEGATIEQWTEAAGMDWRIQRSKVRYFTDAQGAQQLEWPDQHVLFRSDSKAPLGVVSDGYKVVQPVQVLEFFRDLAEHNHFTLETAGTLFGGRQYWALARVGDDAVINGADKVGGFLLLSSSADGSRRTTAKLTTVRVVCNNTLTMAHATKGKAQVAVSHRSTFNAEDVKTDLGIAKDAFSAFVAQAKRLSGVKVTRDDARVLTFSLLAGERNLDKIAAAIKSPAGEKVLESHGYKTIMGLFEGGARGYKLPGVKDTGWGYVNAVTEYVDHFRRARSTENRLASAWFGPGETLKSDALEIVTNLA